MTTSLLPCPLTAGAKTLKSPRTYRRSSSTVLTRRRLSNKSMEVSFYSNTIAIQRKLSTCHTSLGSQILRQGSALVSDATFYRIRSTRQSSLLMSKIEMRWLQKKVLTTRTLLLSTISTRMSNMKKRARRECSTKSLMLTFMRQIGWSRSWSEVNVPIHSSFREVRPSRWRGLRTV